MLYILNRDVAVLKESFHVNLWLRQNILWVTIYLLLSSCFERKLWFGDFACLFKISSFPPRFL